MHILWLAHVMPTTPANIVVTTPANDRMGYGLILQLEGGWLIISVSKFVLQNDRIK